MSLEKGEIAEDVGDRILEFGSSVCSRENEEVRAEKKVGRRCMGKR